MKLLKKSTFLEVSIELAALLRLTITALLKLSFLLPTTFLIHTICTQMMPIMDNNIIVIRPVNFLLFILQK
jgi:hypothetical protein